MTNDSQRHYEIAHIQARLAGEEGADHPRQRLCAFLEREGYGDKIADFNSYYEAKGSSTQISALRRTLDFTFGFSARSDGYVRPQYPDADFPDRALGYAFEVFFGGGRNSDDVPDPLDFAAVFNYTYQLDSKPPSDVIRTGI